MFFDCHEYFRLKLIAFLNFYLCFFYNSSGGRSSGGGGGRGGGGDVAGGKAQWNSLLKILQAGGREAAGGLGPIDFGVAMSSKVLSTKVGTITIGLC